MKADDALVVIERAPSTLLAEELQSLLEAQGIRSFLDPYSAEEVVAGELYTEFTGIDLKVAAKDVSRALGALVDARRAGCTLELQFEEAEEGARSEPGP